MVKSRESIVEFQKYACKEFFFGANFPEEDIIWPFDLDLYRTLIMSK